MNLQLAPTIKVVFHNLDRSEIARDAVLDRLEPYIERFPDLEGHRLHVALEMFNSPVQAGPDLFGVTLSIRGKKFRNVVLQKRSASLYVAIAELCEALLERLNRFGDRERVKSRRRERIAKTDLMRESKIELEGETQ